jgi:hypothetical protein
MARFLIGLIVILVVAVAALGWYRGWYTIGKTNEGDKTNINISVDKDKIREDQEKAQEGLKKLGQKDAGESDKAKKEKAGQNVPKD